VKVEKRSLALVSGLYLVNAAVGTWLAVRDDLPGRPFGWTTGFSPLPDFLFGLGTALSAPLLLLVVLVALNLVMLVRRPQSRLAATMIAALGVGFLIGMLAEPITGEFLDAGHFAPLLATVLIVNVVLPVAIVILGWRVRNL
jgi:hypothetical protein